jgi:glucose-6-phosphate dehydrogenase assembly protein OpcA
MAKHNSVDLEVFLPWAGKKVETAEVEEQLSRLWRLAADNVRISQNIHVRTSVLNFVICAPDAETARQASALIRDLSSTHIARLTLLIFDTSLPSEVSTWVTLRSFPIISDLMRHHFEQITVMATGSAAYASAEIIQPFLKPDLPVYLWWLNEPAEGAVFSRLASISSRVIVDSNSFFDPQQCIESLVALTQELPGSALSDLNWGRITPWRNLVAQFFDTQEYLSYLGGVNRIEIEHAVAPLAGHIRTEQGEISPNPTRALLFAGWLKSSLNWRIVDDPLARRIDPATGSYTWRLTRTTGPLMVGPGTFEEEYGGRTSKLGFSGEAMLSIRPRVQPHLQPGTLCFLRLTSEFEDTHATFTINREEDGDHVLTSVELNHNARPGRVVSLAAAHKVSALLHDELEIMGRDTFYETSLRQVFELLT